MAKIQRAMFACLFVVLAFTSPRSFAFPLTDLWYNPSQGGRGISISQQGTNLFLAFYAYDTSGKPFWVYASGTAVPSSNGSTVSFQGALNEGSGSPLGQPYNPEQFQTSQVGSVSIVFTLSYTAPDTAVMTYTIGNASETINLQRFPTGTQTISGQQYYGFATVTVTQSGGCTIAGQSFAQGQVLLADTWDFTLTMNSSGQITISGLDAYGDTSNISGTFVQEGLPVRISAQGTDSFGLSWTYSGKAVFYPDIFSATFSVLARDSQGNTCSGSATYGAR